jgi:anti-anti-sigma factor
MSQPEPNGRKEAPDIFEVEARTNRRTALIEVRGELDIGTVPQVAKMLDGLALDADGVRHVILDLRRLTFMDASGIHELTRQNHYARENRQNLAVVRGPKAIQRLFELTGVEEVLVLVDDPEDLAPPQPAPAS